MFWLFIVDLQRSHAISSCKRIASFSIANILLVVLLLTSYCLIFVDDLNTRLLFANVGNNLSVTSAGIMISSTNE